MMARTPMVWAVSEECMDVYVCKYVWCPESLALMS